MIPAIFRAKAVVGVEPGTPAHEEALRIGKRDASAAIGFISAIGAFGGFFINRGFGTLDRGHRWSGRGASPPSPPSTRSASA